MSEEKIDVTGMNIYQRLNEVRKHVSYIQKKKKVEGQGYMAVTHDQVTGELREYFIECGIITVPNLIGQSKMIDTGTTTAKGIPFMRYEATYRVDFVNIDAPEEKVSVEIESHAIDQGDKAPGKAISYAVKYAYLKLFNIETGEQEEERPEQKPAPKKEEPRAASGRAETVDAWNDLPEAAKTRLKIIHREMVEQLDTGADVGAYGLVEANKLDSDEITALWSKFNSSERSRLKKAAQYIRTQKEMEAA